ncbi:DUF397 domain-containing protein [Streptomyces sp. DSM 41524]|uniref:DUF397 domain-containing protein n=1 Tax=Streptomyces asiaticus subsp. ignotus TaxID=3098222 RepID=A0ABU7PYK2_9ACTN|nr:DUF397 domain-containing protein [Streptomyces sp. DSM 41524]
MHRTGWRKSSFSGTGPDNNCVELATAESGGIHLRESDVPRTVLTTTPRPLAAFIRAAKAGRFDRPAG